MLMKSSPSAGKIGMYDSDSGMSGSMDSYSDSGSSGRQPGSIFMKIFIPDLHDEKLLQFPLTETAAYVKHTIIGMLDKELKDAQNYGLYLPPANGKTGKFLQEERTLKDYGFQGTNPNVELKYKCRLQRTVAITAAKLKKLHTKSNLRQFVDGIKAGDLSKTSKWLNKGIDPNFHVKETGETPLTLASVHPEPREFIMTLVSGGAQLDFRAVDSMTPIHKATEAGNFDAVKTLLDLGQSPNTRDTRGLTPLYYAVTNDTLSLCVERLLYEHSILGITDDNGLQEIHQACRLGRVQHLEHLISYGANLNSQSPLSGNSPLHVCAQLGQEACARLLLFRGADRNLVNRAGHTPYQQALLADHVPLAKVVQEFQDSDVVMLRASPQFNTQRRTSVPALRAYNRCSSMGRLTDLPLSPSPALSGCSGPTTSGTVAGGRKEGLPTSRSARFTRAVLYEPLSSDTESSFGGSLFESKLGKGSASSATAGGGLKWGRGLSKSVCNLDSLEPGDCSTLTPGGQEGKRGGRVDPAVAAAAGGGGGVGRDMTDSASFTGSITSVKTPTKKKKRGLGGSHGDLLRAVSKSSVLTLTDFDASVLPRIVVLQKSAKGFGFVIRGMREGGNPLDFRATPEIPALQFFDKIDPSSPAQRAGLKPGDYILEVNNENVIQWTHEQLVKMIRKAGDTVALKVVTVHKAKRSMSSASSRQQRQRHADDLDSESDRSSVLSGSTGCSSRTSNEMTASVRSRSSRRITTSEFHQEMQPRRGGGGGATADHKLQGSHGGGGPAGHHHSQNQKQQQQSCSAGGPRSAGSSGAGYSTFRGCSQSDMPAPPATFFSNEMDLKAKLRSHRRTTSSSTNHGGPLSPTASPALHHLVRRDTTAGESDSGVSLASFPGGGGGSSLAGVGGPPLPPSNPPISQHQQTLQAIGGDVSEAALGAASKFYTAPVSRPNMSRPAIGQQTFTSTTCGDSRLLQGEATPIADLPSEPGSQKGGGALQKMLREAVQRRSCKPALAGGLPPPPPLSILKVPPPSASDDLDSPPILPPPPSPLDNKAPPPTGIIPRPHPPLLVAHKPPSGTATAHHTGRPAAQRPRDLPSSKSTPNFRPGPPAPKTSGAGSSHDLHLKDALAQRRRRLDRQSTSDELSPEDVVAGADPSPPPPPKPPILKGKPLKSALKNPSLDLSQYSRPTTPSFTEQTNKLRRQNSGSSLNARHTGGSNTFQQEQQQQQRDVRQSAEDHGLEAVLPPPDFFRDSPRGAGIQSHQQFQPQHQRHHSAQGGIGDSRNTFFATGGGQQRIASSNGQQQLRAPKQFHDVYQV